MALGINPSSKTSLSVKQTISRIPSIPSRADTMPSGHPVQVIAPLFTIPSTLKTTLSTSAIRSLHEVGLETDLANSGYHIFSRNPLLIVKDISPLLLEAHGRLLDAVQPFQGLFDHRGSGPSSYAIADLEFPHFISHLDSNPGLRFR